MADTERDAELLEWARQRDAHARSVYAKRAVRYMADVRHPLKARRLDETRIVVKQWVRLKPPKQIPPRVAKCGHCGDDVDLAQPVMHDCFTGWSRE